MDVTPHDVDLTSWILNPYHDRVDINTPRINININTIRFIYIPYDVESILASFFLECSTYISTSMVFRLFIESQISASVAFQRLTLPNLFVVLEVEFRERDVTCDVAKCHFLLSISSNGIRQTMCNRYEEYTHVNVCGRISKEESR